MKFKVFILSVVAFLILIVSPVYSAEQIGDYESLAEMYETGARFTSITAVTQDGVSRHYAITYFSDLDNNLYLQLKRDGEPHNAPILIAESGFNRAYFELSGKTPNGTYILNGKYWQGTFWSQLGIIDALLPNQENLIVGVPEPTGPGDPSMYMDGNLMITNPPYDGYKVTSERLNIEYGYGIKPGIPKPGKPDITGVDVVPLSHTGTSAHYDSEKDMQYNYFKATVILEPGINTIVVSIDYKGKVYSDTRIVEYLTGLVDEDGDGIDDRTGLPIGSDGSDISLDGAPLLPDNPTIFDYVKYAVDSIIYVFAQVGIAIKGMVSSVGDIGKILTGFFSFMPEPFTGIIVIGLLIAIILRIFGR